MVNVIPPDHVDDIPVVEPKQHDDVLVVPELVLVDPLNPSPPTSESEPEDVIEAENPIEHEDETVPASVHEVGKSSSAAIQRKDGDSLLHNFMIWDIDSLFGLIASILRRLRGHEAAHALVEKKGKAKDKYYGKLILDLGNEARSSVEQGTAAMEKLVEKLGNAEDKFECKKLKKELEEARGFVLEERSNEAIDVSIEDEKSPSIMPLKFAPLTQAAIRRMIKENVDAVIAAERARQANVRNDASGSGPELLNNEDGLRKLRVFFELVNVQRARRFNELALMCPRMVEPKRVKVNGYIWGLTDNIKGEVTSSKPANLNKVVRMAHKLMEQKSQARDEIIIEGKKLK
nr:hypothetical protein [Tanacetum cinerariifolium]